MDIRKVKKLIELVQASDISELEIKDGEESIRICRNLNIDTSNKTSVVPPVTNQTETAVATQQADYDEDDLLISPMVGTFYLAPSPESTPLVKVGQRVEIGDTVCIIEAMKMMNQIQAKHSGTIKAILCHSGDAVEFDQPLMVIE
ncbi:acetyl-CoA carboxylase biotin carboxyl carrier protein subunit [Shewanella colwelliana]|uniref:Biotin carboxyl carrier protein of acetyl-CoA carboxylase n=1 Tax=Shewanella colwelliana TaxID=23 RepID=A0A1E5IS00_SHECO|nr:acetyl-CoA carboxylase biotin carboxyl carrier protein [Shewanella colwelliana]MDX1280073.1 acetyl-CoA carboxylase biotin carboxyl carrier protein [Shewanella colwelliana]OEG73331.1 acetyl-CoA carboxylase, biotin carboxyl carrier protein [Shewanella colwelliana]GIU17429.1 acetyl-CoA carboxylase biotin carboxyl carrier protein subunit [Shewanella colwelliana]GIU38991.1 acetyl-CoA carboxylase biotin carboxyl carrier protein subunit [Shewanella colwelliana]